MWTSAGGVMVQKDSSPESQRAVAASDRANSTGSAADHSAAEEAHVAASSSHYQQYKANGSNAVANYHRQLAVAHEQLADQHYMLGKAAAKDAPKKVMTEKGAQRREAKSVKNRVSSPDPRENPMGAVEFWSKR
jgi:hypothetical protein